MFILNASILVSLMVSLVHIYFMKKGGNEKDTVRLVINVTSDS